jgi:ATP/maltotriose-dependent transcriptional regulator MalT
MRRQIGPHTPADPRRRCAVALLEAGDIDAAEVVLSACEQYAREHGQFDELAMARSRRAWLAFGRGHAGEALSHLRAAAVEAHRAPDGVYRLYFDPIHAFVLAACGEISEARALADQLLAREAVGIFGAFPMALVNYELGDLVGARDRLEEIMPWVEAMAEDDVSSDLTSVLAVQALIHLEMGSYAEALATANRCLVADRSAVSASRSDLLLTVARAALALGDRRRAADAVAALGDLARWATGPGIQAAAALGEALLDSDATRTADAQDRYEAAARAYELAPRWANAADAWCDAAEAALLTGRDPAPAIDAARRICETKGLARVQRRLHELTVELPGSGVDRQLPALQALTPRELEVVHLVAEGCTNREIGNRLYLSEGTVRNYLSRAFDKLGAARRADIVRLVMSAEPRTDPSEGVRR